MGSRGKALGQRSEGLGHFIFSDTNFLTKLSHKLGIIRLKYFFLRRRSPKSVAKMDGAMARLSPLDPPLFVCKFFLGK